MKLMLAAPSYLPSKRANTVQVMKMSQALVQEGHSVHLLVPGLGMYRSMHLDLENAAEGLPASWEELALHYGVQERFSISWMPVRGAFRGYDYAFRALQLFQHRGKRRLVATILQCEDQKGLAVGRRFPLE